MPIYEYKCGKCGVFELVQRITEDPIKRCPTCKSKVERIVSRTSFVLKGSGWYATDYARKGSSEPSSDSGSSSGSSNGTSKSTESKAETKTESAGTTSTSTEKPAAKPAD